MASVLMNKKYIIIKMVIQKIPKALIRHLCEVENGFKTLVGWRQVCSVRLGVSKHHEQSVQGDSRFLEFCAGSIFGKKSLQGDCGVSIQSF